MDISKSKERLFTNVGILAIGTLCSKIISFFLLPLYTSVLPTDVFGTIDVLQAVASILLPIATMELSSAVFRFLIESPLKKEIISTAVWTELLITGIIVAGITVFHHFRAVSYLGIFLIYLVSSVFLGLCQNTTRGFSQNKLFALMGFIATLVSVACNLFFILVLKKGGEYILLADAISFGVSSLFAIVGLRLWRYISIRACSIRMLRDMLRYSLPLIPNAISWWVANTSDRLIIAGFLGTEYNGIYAVANKIGFVYITIYNVYNLAWIEASARCAGDSMQEQFTNELLGKSVKAFGCLTILIICGMSLAFNVLIGPEYASSYHHILILMVAVYLNSMCSLVGGVLTAFKRTVSIGKSTLIGAVVNVVINILLIKRIGLYAASLSTLVSYIFILYIRNKETGDLLKLKWPRSYLIQFAIVLSAVSLGYLSKLLWVNIGLLVIAVIWSCWVNKHTSLEIFSYIRSKLSNKR